MIVAGLPEEDGEDLRAKLDQIWTFMGSSCRVESAVRLPQPRALAAQPQRSPALVKVLLLTEEMASTALALAKNLAKSPALSGVFLRPSRSASDRQRIKEQLQRLPALKAAEQDPNVSYVIRYTKPGFPILRLVGQKPDWTWTDPGPAPPPPAPAIQSLPDASQPPPASQTDFHGLGGSQD